jgi:hypothetical protein
MENRNSNSVDFLLEIMRPRTTATPPGYYCESRDPPESADGRQRSVTFEQHLNQTHYYDDVAYNKQLIHNELLEMDDYEENTRASCLAEFGVYIKGLFSRMDNYYASKRRRQIDLLRRTKDDADKSKTMLELELRTQLIEIKTQRQEMEEAFRREIAREFSEKVIRQAQLQSRLLSMIEQRVNMDIQLSRLDVNEEQNMQRQSGEVQSHINDSEPVVGGIKGGSDDIQKSFQEFGVGPNGPTSPVLSTTSVASKGNKESSISNNRTSYTPRSKAPSSLRVQTTSTPSEQASSRSLLPFSPTHCYSPANAMSPSKAVTFFGETRSTTSFSGSKKSMKITPKRSALRSPGRFKVVVEERSSGGRGVIDVE